MNCNYWHKDELDITYYIKSLSRCSFKQVNNVYSIPILFSVSDATFFYSNGNNKNELQLLAIR